MKLAVLGDAPLAVVNAAWASAATGETVEMATTSLTPGLHTMNVLWQGSSKPAVLVNRRGEETVDADAFLLVGTHEEVIIAVQAHARYMRGRPILAAPGAFALAESMHETLSRRNVEAASIGQAAGYPVAGDTSTRLVRVRSVKRSLPVGILDRKPEEQLLSTFQRWFSDIVESPLAEVVLSGVNNIVHPPVVLMNAARVESGAVYSFFQDGLSPGSARLISKVDDERMAILSKLGHESKSLKSLFEQYYGDQGLRGQDLATALGSFPALASLAGPTTLDHRFVTDDVAYGLAPMELLAQVLEVRTPALSAVITALSVACGIDLRCKAEGLLQLSSIT